MVLKTLPTIQYFMKTFLCMIYCQEYQIQLPISGACVKVDSDLGFGGGFCWVLQFPPPVTTGKS